MDKYYQPELEKFVLLPAEVRLYILRHAAEIIRVYGNINALGEKVHLDQAIVAVMRTGGYV